jgi:hypothetical protein
MVSFGADGRHASATWHVDVKVGTPLDGEFTAAQMARLQGMLADVRWESGQLHAQYVRSGDHWQVESVSYEATRT